MFMPGRIGYKSASGSWVSQPGEASPDNGLEADISIDSRVNNQPPEYTATASVELQPGFESGAADEFLAYISEEEPGSGGSGSGSSSLNGYYRFGFNGKENDNEIKGTGNQQDYGMRIYDPRLGRFLSVDPLEQEYPFYTPYQFAGNTPVRAVDLDGAEMLLDMIGNPADEKNTAKLKNNFGVAKGSWGDKSIDFASGALSRALELGNPITYLKMAGDHLKNMWSNGKAIVKANSFSEGAKAAVSLGIPSLNSTEQALRQGQEAFEDGDFRAIGGMSIDVGSAILTYRVSTSKTGIVTKNVENTHSVFSGASATNTASNIARGRLGNSATRTQIGEIATELESRGYTITGGGGRLPEEFLRPLEGGRQGGSYVDITAKHPKYGVLRINTVDMNKTGVPTTRELINAARIRQQIKPREHLLLIPKKQ